MSSAHSNTHGGSGTIPGQAPDYAPSNKKSVGKSGKLTGKYADFQGVWENGIPVSSIYWWTNPAFGLIIWLAFITGTILMVTKNNPNSIVFGVALSLIFGILGLIFLNPAGIVPTSLGWQARIRRRSIPLLTQQSGLLVVPDDSNFAGILKDAVVKNGGFGYWHWPMYEARLFPGINEDETKQYRFTLRAGSDLPSVQQLSPKYVELYKKDGEAETVNLLEQVSKLEQAGVYQGKQPWYWLGPGLLFPHPIVVLIERCDQYTKLEEENKLGMVHFEGSQYFQASPVSRLEVPRDDEVVGNGFSDIEKIIADNLPHTPPNSNDENGAKKDGASMDDYFINPWKVEFKIGTESLKALKKGLPREFQIWQNLNLLYKARAPRAYYPFSLIPRGQKIWLPYGVKIIPVSALAVKAGFAQVMILPPTPLNPEYTNDITKDSYEGSKLVRVAAGGANIIPFGVGEHLVPDANGAQQCGISYVEVPVSLEALRWETGVSGSAAQYDLTDDFNTIKAYSSDSIQVMWKPVVVIQLPEEAAGLFVITYGQEDAVTAWKAFLARFGQFVKDKVIAYTFTKGIEDHLNAKKLGLTEMKETIKVSLAEAFPLVKIIEVKLDDFDYDAVYKDARAKKAQQEVLLQVYEAEQNSVVRETTLQGKKKDLEIAKGAVEGAKEGARLKEMVAALGQDFVAKQELLRAAGGGKHPVVPSTLVTSPGGEKDFIPSMTAAAAVAKNTKTPAIQQQDEKGEK